VLALAGVLALALFTSYAHAQDPSAGLGEAEARAASAEVAIAEAEEALSPAKSTYAVAARRAAPLDQAAAAAHRRLHTQQAALIHRRTHARAQIAALESTHQEEQQDHDDVVSGAIGLAIALLLSAAIALAWGWFRASAGVAALVNLDLGQAVGLCLGGGLLLLLVGGVLTGSGGLLHVIAVLLVCLGLILPMALLLARHSAEVQRGRAKALLKRPRLPRAVSVSVAALCGVFFLASLGSAAFANGPDSSPVNAQMRSDAAGQISTATRAGLAADKAKAQKLGAQAANLNAERGAAQKALAAVESELEKGQSELTSAQGAARHFSRRLAALELREGREAEAAERAATREAERAAEEAEEEAAEECDPNYSGCLDPNAVDYDCEGGSGDGPLYTGEVEVLGVDHYGLDEEGDGIGCEGD
jgi:hypothetical protein